MESIELLRFVFSFIFLEFLEEFLDCFEVTNLQVLGLLGAFSSSSSMMANLSEEERESNIFVATEEQPRRADHLPSLPD